MPLAGWLQPERCFAAAGGLPLTVCCATIANLFRKPASTFALQMRLGRKRKKPAQ